MHDKQPNIAKLEEILKNEDTLKKFLMSILIFKEKIPSSSKMIESESYEDIDNIIKVEDSINEEIVVDINCNGLAIRENHEGDLIVHVCLFTKPIENNNFCVTRIDIMATGDGKAHFIHRETRSEEITKFYSKRHYLIMP